MHPLEDNKNCDFAKFFKRLGYTYSWDFSKTDGARWHELYDKEDELIFQCEMGIPLKQVVDDLCVIEEIQLDYVIASKNQEVYDRFCARVREFMKRNPNCLE